VQAALTHLQDHRFVLVVVRNYADAVELLLIEQFIVAVIGRGDPVPGGELRRTPRHPIRASDNLAVLDLLEMGGVRVRHVSRADNR